MKKINWSTTTALKIQFVEWLEGKNQMKYKWKQYGVDKVQSKST